MKEEKVTLGATGRQPVAPPPIPEGGGFQLVDKARGISSFQALYPVKRIFRGKKVGHAGTLDPDASGLLLVGVDKATRLLEYMEKLPKDYRFTIRLGVATDTYDMQGEVAERHEAGHLTAAIVEDALKGFRGEQDQMPPDYSAIKIAGKRACDRVRSGETVELKARKINVYRFELEGFEPAESGGTAAAHLRLLCSRGTYVRSLAHDIGRLLGVGGAADEIRRMAIGPFRVEDAITADDVEALGRLVPVSQALEFLPVASVAPVKIHPVLNGMTLGPSEYRLVGAPAANAETPYRILSGTRLLAVGRILPDGSLCPEKVLTRN